MGGDDFGKGKGGGGPTERIEHPIQDEGGALVDRLQSRVDNWSETASRRIAQNVTDHIEVAVTRAADLRRSYYVLGIEIPPKRMNSSIWSKIRGRLVSWLKENGLDYHFSDPEATAKTAWGHQKMSLFNAGGTLGKRGWDMSQLFTDTGCHEAGGYNYSEEFVVKASETIEIESDWVGFMLGKGHRDREHRYRSLILHWNLEY